MLQKKKDVSIRSRITTKRKRAVLILSADVRWVSRRRNVTGDKSVSQTLITESAASSRLGRLLTVAPDPTPAQTHTSTEEG